MKYAIILLTTVLFLISCAPTYKSYKCAPSKGSRDYARQQRLRERSDGYWEVTTIGMRKRIDNVYECKPTQQILDSLKRASGFAPKG
jgi:hypothetical protein